MGFHAWFQRSFHPVCCASHISHDCFLFLLTSSFQLCFPCVRPVEKGNFHWSVLVLLFGLSFSAAVPVEKEVILDKNSLLRGKTGVARKLAVFEEKAKIFANDIKENQKFGKSLSLSNGILLVGAPGSAPDLWGTAHIMERDAAGDWVETAVLSGDPGIRSYGISVSISGNVAVVGSTPFAFVFEKDASGSWNRVAKFESISTTMVAVSDSLIVVGDPLSPQQGPLWWRGENVNVFQKNITGSWSKVAELVPNNQSICQKNCQFGFAVAIANERIIVGTGTNDNVYIYEKDESGAWNEVAWLNVPANQFGRRNEFGRAVALDPSGEVAVVGAFGTPAYFDNTWNYDVGAAYVFERDADGSWNEIAKLTAADPSHNARFGYKVAIANSDRILVGALGGIGVGPPGAAYVFERTEGAGWVELEKLTNHDADPTVIFSYFADSIAMSDSMAVVGNFYDSEHAHNNGAVYIFGSKCYDDGQGPAVDMFPQKMGIVR